MSQELFFEYQNTHLAYVKLGQGPRVLLAFHGFGQDKVHFEPLAEALESQFTVYSFDLFYHGNSSWPDKQKPLSKVFWQELLKNFLAQESIERFSLVGFSLGGKFALASLESFAPQVDELLLIAPDGIRTSFWYSLATYPGWTRNFFRSLVNNPKPFQKLAQGLQTLRIVDKGIVRFAESQMQTRAQRLRVYNAWVVFRELQFNLDGLKQLLNKYRVRTTLFLGRYDRIITEANLQNFLKSLRNQELVVLQSGHNNLIRAAAVYYQSAFSGKSQ